MRIFESLRAYADAVGTEIGTSDWYDISQERIDRFADVTEDHQWIHVDPERCRRELGTGTIAHGYLVLSLVAAMAQQTFRIDGVTRTLNYGSDKIRFISPVPSGSRVRGVFRIDTADWRGDELRTRTGVTVEIEGQERPALIAETVSLHYS